MIENCIVGSGFSAAITYLLLNKKSDVFSVVSEKKLKKIGLNKRDNLVSNKLFSKKVFSMGTINYQLKKGIFHDTNTLGGNTNIWGGHVDLKKISKKLIKYLEENGLFFKDLSYQETGTNSNLESIVQIQDKNQNIFSSKLVFNKINDFFLYSFLIKKKKIILNLINLKTLKTKKIKVKKLFLCLGTIQLIELLKRSNYLKDKDVITLTEFDHELKVKFKKNVISKKENTSIKYKFSRAIGHYLGIQSFKKFLKLLNFIPIYIEQIFYNKKKIYQFFLINQTLKEINNYNFKKFGDSIHYCGMKINNTKISDYLKKINNNIFGFGMSFVSQSRPGPISNDIILDIFKKLEKNKSLKKF